MDKTKSIYTRRREGDYRAENGVIILKRLIEKKRTSVGSVRIGRTIRIYFHLTNFYFVYFCPYLLSPYFQFKKIIIVMHTNIIYNIHINIIILASGHCLRDKWVHQGYNLSFITSLQTCFLK